MPAHLIDMEMMAMFGTGRARTEDTFGALLASGLALRRVVATASSVSIIEAGPE